MSCKSDVASKNGDIGQCGCKEIIDALQDCWGAFLFGGRFVEGADVRDAVEPEERLFDLPPASVNPHFWQKRPEMGHPASSD
jgi:hypothetical protein